MTTLDEEQALDLLYGEQARDLTADGIQQALSELQRLSPALAKRVRGALEGRLAELFARRRIAWHDTSVGTKYRVALLPNNPWFENDVVAVRHAVGILEEGVGPWSSDLVRENLGLSEHDAELIEDRDAAWEWIRRHQRAMRGLVADTLSQRLNESAAQVADRAAQIDPSILEPEWLRARPQEHPRCLYGQTPFHWVVSRLLERHRLPPHICGRVQTHVLTMRKEDLENLEPIAVTIATNSNEVRPGGFSMTVEGIDEFTIKEDWDRIWKQHVRPRQNALWDRRGRKPAGRKTRDLETLRDALSVYHVSLRVGSVEKALDELQRAGAPQGAIGTTHVGDVLRELDDLLRPV